MRQLSIWFALLLLACSTPSAKTSAPDVSQEVAVPAVTFPDATFLVDEDVPVTVLPPPPVLETRSALQLAQAACQRADGKWACKGIAKPAPLLAASGQPPVNSPVLTISNWYLDPQNGTGCASDANSGTSATCGAAGVGPLLTWGQVIQRYGTTSPVFPTGNSVFITFLSAQSPNTDPIYFTPQMSGGGTGGIGTSLTITGTPTVVATTTLGTVTPKARGGPGTLLQVANMPAGTVAGQFVQNFTHPSGAFIQSMSGQTATMEQPVNFPTTEVDTWTTGDSITISTMPLINLKDFGVITGGDENAAHNGFNQAIVENMNIADSSGNGTSQFLYGGYMYPDYLINVLMSPGLVAVGNVLMVNTSCLSSFTVSTSSGTTGEEQMFGGLVAGAISIANARIFVSDDAQLRGAVTVLPGSYADINLAYSTSTWTVESYLRPRVSFWGSYTINLFPYGVMWIGSSTFASIVTTSGALTFGTAGTTGYTPPASGTFTNNGVTQVDVTGTFPINATISWSLATVGGTPCLAGGPYFSAANTAGNFFTKSATESCNDVYNWSAQPAPVTVSVANIDTYKSLVDPIGNAMFSYEN